MAEPARKAGTGRRISARWRIAGWILLTTTFGLCALVVTVHSVLETRVYADADADLVQETAEFRRLADVGIDPGTGQPFSSAAVLLRTYVERQRPGSNEILLALVPNPSQHAAPAARNTWTVVGDRMPTDAARLLRADRTLWQRLLTEPAGAAESPVGSIRWAGTDVESRTGEPGRYVVIEVLDRAVAEVWTITWLMIWVAAAAAALSALWAVVVAGRVLRPLRSLRETVQGIGPGEVDRRIPVGGDGVGDEVSDAAGDDEVADVARAVNAVLDRLQAALDHEQLFVNQARTEVAVPLQAARARLAEAPPRPDAVPRAVRDLDDVDRVLDDLYDLAASRRPGFVRPQPTELAGLSRDLLHAARAAHPDRRWVLTEVATDQVLLDRDRVLDALARLATNAAQHSPPRADIELASAVTAGPDGPEVVLSVTDRGPGLSAERAATVFDRFAESQDERRGLGLAMVRAVAEAHGGVAYVRSGAGGGAAFGLAIPIGSRS